MKSVVFQILFIVSALLCFGSSSTPPSNLKTYHTDIKPKPNLYVLSIGATPPNIRYTIEDAIDVYDVFSRLRTREGLYKEIIVEQLAGKQATALNILNRFRNTVARISSGDVLILFISSHGYRDRDNFRIQGSDFDVQQPYSGSISLYELVGHLDEVSAQKLVFLDACASGGNGTLLTEKIGKKGGIQGKIDDITNTSNSTIITSSSGTQNSYWHTAWENGAFTEALIEGLKGTADANQNKVITTKEIYSYLTRRVPQLCEEQNAPSPQQPYCTQCEFDHHFPFYNLNNNIQNEAPDTSPLWRTHYSAYPLTLTQNENTKKHEWQHEASPFFYGTRRDRQQHLGGTVNFAGTNKKLDLKITINIEGDAFKYYGKISGYTPINIELKNKKRITLHGYQYRAKYNSDTNQTKYIITCNVNTINEKLLYETSVRAISIEWLTGKEEYQCTKSDALIKQLHTIQESKKNGIIAKCLKGDDLYGADSQ